MHLLDESTCCDEDFTWVRTDPPIESRSLPTDQVINSPITNNSAKPPRPAGSLDRRRQSHTNRQERDNKSRSAHSLKERSVSSEFKDTPNDKGAFYHAMCLMKLFIQTNLEFTISFSPFVREWKTFHFAQLNLKP